MGAVFDLLMTIVDVAISLPARGSFRWWEVSVGLAVVVLTIAATALFSR